MLWSSANILGAIILEQCRRAWITLSRESLQKPHVQNWSGANNAVFPSSAFPPQWEG